MAKTHEERFPLARIMVGNSVLLSTIYLSLGLLVELARTYFPSVMVIRISQALDRLPAGVLSAVGLLEVLKDAYRDQQVSDLQLRLVFGGTTVAIIFTLGVLVGAGMWGAMKVQAVRASRSGAPGE